MMFCNPHVTIAYWYAQTYMGDQYEAPARRTGRPTNIRISVERCQADRAGAGKYALVALTSWLDRQRIPYMVIGGFAVTIWGEPRFTRDLDVRVSVPAGDLIPTIDLVCSQFRLLASDPAKFVTETRVLPIVVRSVPVDLIFALPYEDAAIARSKPIQCRRQAA